MLQLPFSSSASADIVLGEVTLKNVTGMTFGITKEVSGDKVTNTLTVGGTVTARGDNPAVTIDGAYITGEFSVNNLTMTVGSYGATVLKNATFTIQSKATVAGTGSIQLAQNGATVTVNGTAYAAGDGCVIAWEPVVAGTEPAPAAPPRRRAAPSRAPAWPGGWPAPRR